MAKLFNLAKENTNTTGSGTMTLTGASTGYLTFEESGVLNEDVVSYGVEDGNEREVGRGVYTTSGSTLTRSVLNSTNSGSPIDLSGNANVFITALAEDISVDGWSQANETWAYASASTITVPSGAAAVYSVGDKIRWKQGGAYKYAYIITVADTLLTVAGGSAYTVADAAITDNYYSHIETAVGFPGKFVYTPSTTGLTVGNGVLSAYFSIHGKICFCSYKFVFGSFGSAFTSEFTVSFPFTAGYVISASSYFTNVNEGYWAALTTTESTAVFVYAMNAAATYATATVMSNTIPYTWEVNDQIEGGVIFFL